MAQLLKDGFAGISDQSIPSQAKYYITVEGIIQKSNGGYTTIFNDRAKIKKHAKENRILSFVAVGVSILASGVSYYNPFEPVSSIFLLPNSNISHEKPHKLNKLEEKPLQLQKTTKEK